MATDFGYPLSPRFAIHPRPFDRLLAIALEIFTRAPAGKENEELGLVAEYLAFFLDGPSMPRASMSGRRRPILDLHLLLILINADRRVTLAIAAAFRLKGSVSLIGSLPISRRRPERSPFAF